LLTALLALLVASRGAHVSASKDKCAQTAHMRIYSNAHLSEETGDVVGYELAVERRNESAVDALLYLYEGEAHDDGIHISGSISGKKLTLNGSWVEHLIEYPAKKEVVQTHLVKIDGTLDSGSFPGRIIIEGLTPDNVRLKRVERIWVCKP